MIEKMNYYGKRGIPFLFVVDFACKHPHCIPLADIDKNTILYFVNGLTNASDHIRHNKNIAVIRHAIPYEVYLNAFNKIREQLGDGNTYLVNLTFPTKIETSVPLKDIFFFAHAKYKLWFKDAFVVFSPEPFIRISNRIISAFPMKGTIDASIDNARETILQDEKERAEHVTIVDLIRNDLSIVAKDVSVKRFRYVETIKTNRKNLLQISSEITGKLDPGYHERIGNILFSLLPAGSVTGAPKKRTVEIIKSTENYNRNYYTGIFGYFDGRNLDSAVMIRFMENTPGGYVFKSGGGITIYSDPEKEYQELNDKIYVPVI